MNNITDYYGCSKFSDVTIQLKNGTLLPAHKLVLTAVGGAFFSKLLDNEYRETTTNIISFPQHDDNTIIIAIKYLYGIKPAPEGSEWLPLMTFAHYADIQKLMADLAVVPPEVSTAQLLNLVILTGHQPWMSEVVDRLAIDENSSSLDIGYDDYLKLRDCWKSRGYSHYWLFRMDCNYCQALIDDENNNITDPTTYVIEFLNNIIPTIDFSTFSSYELTECCQLPVVSDVPMISHLLSLMPKTRPIICFEDKKSTSRITQKIESTIPFPGEKSRLYGIRSGLMTGVKPW